MKLYFVNSQGKRTLVAEPKRFEEVHPLMDKFLAEHNFKSYYTIINSFPDKFQYDFGSHTEFFELEGYTRAQAQAYFTNYQF